MGYCKFCGKELDSEGRCTCAEFEEEHKMTKEKIKADELTDGKAKKILIGIGVAAIIVIIAIIVCLIISGLNAYKKPLDSLAKGIKKGDAQLLLETMYTEDGLAEKKVRVKDSGLEWEDFIKDTDKILKNNNDLIGRKRLKANIIAKEKLSGSNFDEIKNYYKKEFDADVKKAYRVEVNFTMREQGNKSEADGWLCVVKLKDGGWKYCPRYSPDQHENRFEFIETSIAAVDK